MASLDVIAKNIQLIVTLHVGQGDFKALQTKTKDTSTLQQQCRHVSVLSHDDCSNNDELCVFEHDFQVDGT